MLFSARLATTLLAVVPLVASFPQELTRSTREFCKSEPSPDLLALHELIVNEDKPTMDKIAQGEAHIQDALERGESGLHSRSPSMQVTRRDTGELITLDIWFHVVYNQNSTQGGYITVRCKSQ
ncbi:hypothetical protein NQ176_g10841 [Zarea fungicola]|uniref:Uncharacterized protein n=1 Tax=Zarea fungicola TaxID=93591 RepID=A0ACC1MFJ2_9HYPO|nr:hypothetical protein NQ176_g10841 [Lecanicillium fungicola]